ncbi:Uncharacterized protein dnm_011800 [Desulfonema magnum]|uniref:Uncharacterized protein n=1 Tax=Desulfonema magnum TaxID=45655 RepID=A0A975BH40_9BACT|nr:Uncharacterized protein dnm_011800 [Desulfonema magnum]
MFHLFSFLYERLKNICVQDKKTGGKETRLFSPDEAGFPCRKKPGFSGTYLFCPVHSKNI